MRVCQIDFSYFSVCKCFEYLVAQSRRIRIGRSFHHVRSIQCNVIISPSECLYTFSSYGIDVEIFFRKITACNQFDNVGIISTCQSSIRSNDNDCFSFGIACLQIRMIDIATSCQHGTYGFVHIIEIRVRLFRTAFGFL